MYKGKTFELWYDKVNEESLLNVIFRHNKISITLKLDEFMKFKKDISKLDNEKIVDIKGHVCLIKCYKKDSVKIFFQKNNVDIRLPKSEFKHFKNEIDDIKDDFIKEYVESEGEEYLDDLNETVEVIKPKKTFKDIIINDEIKKQMDISLAQIKNHDLIFNDWGLGKKHDYGTSVSLNFIGMPGTGKTLAAEVIANELNKKLHVVQYSNLVDSYIGETGKNIKLAFEYASNNDAVLFFDEADAIISTRTNVLDSTDSLINMDKSILLRKLETFKGVVIFSTNLASNIDKAFERRISSHIYFGLPEKEEREKIYNVLIGDKMPLDSDVDFGELADKYSFSGGDIKNVILNSARLAANESLDNKDKTIKMKHFLEAAEMVDKGKDLMETSLLEGDRNDLKKFASYIG
ncbi:AAA family ATPase [archaeon]|nr:AAA family ATPase [archaeon]|tara:strand:+ start:1844 stop:3058 length:1215 start_codon:yes stop_codon:yes gene_type:complete